MTLHEVDKILSEFNKDELDFILALDAYLKQQGTTIQHFIEWKTNEEEI